MHVLSLDLNMGYYNIKLSPRKTRSILFYYHGESVSTKNYLWGFVIAPNIFQEKISELFKGFYMVSSHIYNLLVINKNYFVD